MRRACLLLLLLLAGVGRADDFDDAHQAAQADLHAGRPVIYVSGLRTYCYFGGGGIALFVDPATGLRHAFTSRSQSWIDVYNSEVRFANRVYPSESWVRDIENPLKACTGSPVLLQSPGATCTSPGGRRITWLNQPGHVWVEIGDAKGVVSVLKWSETVPWSWVAPVEPQPDPRAQLDIVAPIEVFWASPGPDGWRTAIFRCHCPPFQPLCVAVDMGNGRMLSAVAP